MKYLFLICLYFGFPVLCQAQYGNITSGSVNFTFVSKDVKGSVSGFSTTSEIDWNDLENSIIEGYVLSETLKTGNFIRDWALQGRQYFDTDTFPKITFKSSSIEVNGEGLLVYGTLTMKGISKPIEIELSKNDNSLEGTTTLFTPDYDITIVKKSREANAVVVRFDLKLE